jgi:thymidylate synthase
MNYLKKMKQYLELLKDVLENGVEKNDRTGTGTKSIFGRQIRFNLQEGFPLLTTKKIFIKGVIGELLWFLGCHMKDDRYKDLPITNIKYLQDNGIKIWNDWINEKGDIGFGYPKQWTHWEGKNGENYNQIDYIIEQLKNNPDSRRMVLSAWNVSELSDMQLVPCHHSFQVYSQELKLIDRINLFNKYVEENQLEVSGMSTEQAMKHYNFPTRKLSLKWTQRSVDQLLGCPFNIASYAFLIHMLCEITNHIPGELIASLGDVHLYNNHIPYAIEQLTRTPKKLPELKIKRKVDSIYNYKIEDFEIINYNPYPNWKNVPIAV